MCMKNNQPINEYNSPCGSCPEYLNSCMPVVINGFLIECDLCYCEWCSCYEDCMNGGVKHEVAKLWYKISYHAEFTTSYKNCTRPLYCKSV